MLSSAVIGALLAVLAGVLNGVSMLPMRYLGKWEWENVWLPYILICCALMPAAMTALTVHAPLAALAAAPNAAVVAALVGGALWGLGAILFGQAVSAAGIALTNTVVMAISASLGSLLPLLLLHAGSLSDARGRMVLAGAGMAIVGMIFSGVAGSKRESDRRVANCAETEGQLVGKRRSFAVALLLCIGAGLLSAVFNIGFSLAQPLMDTVVAQGGTASGGTNLIWLLMLGAGAVVNTIFCVSLFIKNGSARKFLLPGGGRLFALTAIMGFTWGGAMFAYGEASNHMGKLGPVIGWPLFLTTALLVGNLSGIATGEWRGVRLATRWWMGCGLAVLVLAILTLGRAGAL